MSLATITPGAIKTGPGKYRYAPLATTLPTVAAVGSTFAAVTWAAGWVEIGATEAGLTYTESVETTAVTVAESLYPVRTNTTGKTGTVELNMSHVHDLNWKLAMNGGTITVTGATTTKMSLYVPPLAGSEVRVMLAFQSVDDDEIIIWGQCLNTGSVATTRGSIQESAKHGLPTSFTADLPADTANWTTPYKRWTAGALSVSP